MEPCNHKMIRHGKKISGRVPGNGLDESPWALPVTPGGVDFLTGDSALPYVPLQITAG